MPGEEADELVQSFQDIGMSGYEAKAYLALSPADEPLNGYEVAKRSRVPRSTVYETLGKLLSRGAAFEVQAAGGSVQYLALPPDALVSLERTSFDARLARLSEMLPRTLPPSNTNQIHNI